MTDGDVIAIDEKVFVDTNVLLTATDKSRQNHHRALELLRLCMRTGRYLVVSGQVLREYLVVATRPTAVNGFGQRPEDALNNVNKLLRGMELAAENSAVNTELMKLIRDHDLKGKHIHDANIAATMMAHQIRVLITENDDDFGVFDQVEALQIADAVAVLGPA